MHLLLFLTALLAGVGAEMPASTAWDGSEGDWTSSRNWRGGVPGASTIASIRGHSNVRVPPGLHAVAMLHCGVDSGDRAAMRIDGGQLVVRSSFLRLGEMAGSQAEIDLNDGALHVASAVYVGGYDDKPGRETNAALRIRGGSFLARLMWIGIAPGSQSTFEIDGSRASSVHILDFIQMFSRKNARGEASVATLSFVLDAGGVTPITIQLRHPGGGLKLENNQPRLRISLRAPPPSGDILLVSAHAPTHGTFAGLPEGSTVAAGFDGRTYRWKLTYRGGKSGCDLVLLDESGRGVARAAPRPPEPLFSRIPLFGPPSSAGPVPFAGAEGYGAVTGGGRGGRTIEVATLADGGPGSFRAAIEAQGPRTVVFRVGGAIDLKSPIIIREPFLTVSGETAPLPGILLRGHGMIVNTHDVILRYFRIRPGDGAEYGGDGEDALWFNSARRCIADHLSTGWGTDETLSITNLSDEITIQWCIISEGLNDKMHGYASGAGGRRITWHHNLFAHHVSRVVRFADHVHADFRNNVLYNWGHTSGYGEFERLNYVNNYLKPGPSTTQKPPLIHTASAVVPPGALFLAGNVMAGRPEVTADNRRGVPYEPETFASTPEPAAPVRTETALAALESVLQGAGATLPARDAVDARVVMDVRQETGRIINSIREVGGWPADRGMLKVRVLDVAGGRPVPARVNVIGSDHAFYEPAPAQNPLAAFSLKRAGNRSNVGPLRFYGSFFYTDGVFEVCLPPGATRVEVWRGYGHHTAVATPVIAAGRTAEITVTPAALIDAAAVGWHALDPHLHFDRGQPGIDGRIASLMAASGIGLGYVMTQRSPMGYGAASAVSAHGVSLASGYEIVNPQLGHVNVLMAEGEIPSARPPGTDPENLTRRVTAPLAALYDEVHVAGGAMQHDHGGYGQEILADVVLGKSDWVELLQFGAYRARIGLQGWYDLLNSGFRYPLAGGSDYPACRVFADSITFVAGRAPDLRSAIGGMRRGESFATSGPLLFLEANGQGPGSDLEYTGPRARTVAVRVLAASADLPITSLAIVRDGEVAAEWHDTRPVFRKELTAKLDFPTSGWVAARCSGPGSAHAHTNPVWIVFDRKPPYRAEAYRQVRQAIGKFAASKIGPEARQVLEAALAKRDPAAAWPPAAADPYKPELRPRIADPPKAPVSTVVGEVVDAAGAPVAGAVVEVRGGEPSARTDRRGRFALRTVDQRPGLFLRVRKPGHLTVNTQYLNAGAGRVHILCPTREQGTALTPSPAAKEAIILLQGAAAEDVTAASPACRFSRASSGAELTVGVLPIVLQETWPAERDPYEPNLIVTLRSGEDIVLPAFPGQLAYADLRERVR